MSKIWCPITFQCFVFLTTTLTHFLCRGLKGGWYETTPCTIKRDSLKTSMCYHFTVHWTLNIICSFHYLCLCLNCSSLPRPTNLHSHSITLLRTPYIYISLLTQEFITSCCQSFSNTVTNHSLPCLHLLFPYIPYSIF